MQFSCESCKAQLQIADEKVRGKRLIVRCKRCGAKIAISDPALGVSRPAPAKPAAPGLPGVAAPRAGASVPPAAARPGPLRDSDTESTRAMSADVLEQALQASKAESTRAMDSKMLEQALHASAAEDPALALASATPAPARPAMAAGADGGEWFAMLHGKQTGPLTRAELAAKTDQGEVGPRTYLWKEGMDAWQRAKDLPDLASLFPQLPPAPSPAAPTPPASPPSQKGEGLREFTAEDFASAESSPPAAAAEPPRVARPSAPGRAAAAAGKPPSAEERSAADGLAPGRQESVEKELFPSEGAAGGSVELDGWAGDELQKKTARRPRSPRPVMFESAAPPRSRGVWRFVLVGIAVLAGVLYWLEFRTSPPARKGEAADAGVAEPAKPSAPSANKPEAPPPAKPEEKAAEKAEARPVQPEARPPAAPAGPIGVGLTADQVRRKLDENKASLQSCIDEALKGDPNLRVGKIHISTTIAPTGKVTQARIDKSNVDESPLGACLRKATKKIVFPPFKGGAFDVDIPIVVTAGD